MHLANFWRRFELLTPKYTCKILQKVIFGGAKVLGTIRANEFELRVNNSPEACRCM